jgi:dienelactone hydrolase
MDAPEKMNRRTAIQTLAAAGALAPQPAPTPPPDQPRIATPAGADSGSLYPLIESIAARNEYTHSFLGSRFTSVEAYRSEGRAAAFAALGPRPDPVNPRPEIVDRRDMGEFIREKVIFSTTRDFRVPAYVHIPKNLKGRAPAIVDLHSHGGMFIFGKEKVIDMGANHPAMTVYHQANYAGRPTATALARRGYVVITIDAFPFGERRLMEDVDLRHGWERSKYSVEDVKYLNSKCRAKEDTVVKSLTYAGQVWPGITAWDDIRTVDYLCTRPEVDPKRIGCVGVSFGGWRSLFLNGLDDRIAAGCVVGFMSTVKPMIRKHVDTHSFVHFVPGLHRCLDLPDVVALRAPRPLLVLQCRRDGLFPLAGMEEAVRKLAAIYEKAGAPANFTSRFHDVPHIFDVEMQEVAFAWFDQRLKG